MIFNKENALKTVTAALNTECALVTRFSLIVYLKFAKLLHLLNILICRIHIKTMIRRSNHLVTTSDRLDASNGLNGEVDSRNSRKGQST